VVQKIENKERHDEKINREDPDWFLIYHYLAMLLNGEELPVLGQIGPVLLSVSIITVVLCTVALSARVSTDLEK